jgi:hypothetical protein
MRTPESIWRTCGVGLLDRARDITSDAHIYTKEKASFVEITDGKPQYEGYYSDRSEVYRDEVKGRIAALDVAVDEYKSEMMRLLQPQQ